MVHGEAPEAAGVAGRLDLARRVTTVAATLALRKDCVGGVWDEVPRIVPVAELRRAGQRIEQGRDPAGLWVELLVGAEADPELHTLRSTGLGAFFGREIEIEPMAAPAETLRQAAGAVLAHVFADGAMIESGSMFRIDSAGDFLAVLDDEGTVVAGPVCRLVRLPTPEEAAKAVGGARQGRRRCSAIVLFDPARLPDAGELSRAMARVEKRIGLAPAVSETAPDRLVADWGVVRGGGARKSEIIHRGWRLPEALRSFLRAENGETVIRHPELLDSAPVLIRELPTGTGEGGILGATLLAGLASALLALPGARGMIWPTAGLIVPREAAEAQFRRSGAELPIGLTVARLALELEGGGRVFVTRGLSDLGERDILMNCDDTADPAMRAAFEALVRGAFQRQLHRRGDHFVNAVDGAGYDLREEDIPGIGPVLRARLVEPPRPPSGLKRLFGRKD